jgi:hypothetical protein
MTASLAFDPHLPWSVLLTFATIALLLIGWGAFRRARGLVWRLAFTGLLLLALANPLLRQEEREPLDDITLLVNDVSPSDRLGGRTERREQAAAALRQRIAELPAMQLREIEVPGGSEGTRLFDALETALGELDRSRLAGIVALTDGQIHDVPAPERAAETIRAPLHVLVTGRRDETDRRLRVTEAPTFAMVGEEQSLTFEVDDQPTPTGARARVTLRQDGRVIRELEAMPGTPQSVTFALDKAGPTVIELEVEPWPGELTALNNRAVVTINGVRDRLRVLLVSGQPYPGLRVWRNLLKADPAVDLVHFTILRPPEKQDGTPIRELALIAFPSRELFELKLHEFDLVIFDRYNRRGLLPLPYLENVARYVEEGGALLEAAGPEFATPTSLYRTPLARVLPGRPSGEIFERGYLPAVSDLGRRHPVTAELAVAAGEEPAWGRWFRQVDVEAEDAQVLMTGVADRPLLLLKRVGEGRVAQLLSDHHWLWQRGYEEGGPQAALLRRLVHWLMKEPELEEETLSARPADDGFIVERRSLKGEPVTVELVAPDGSTREVTVEPNADGIGRAHVPAAEDGLWRISDGERTAYATPRPIAEIELAEMRATDALLAPIAAATGGAVQWLAHDGLPELRRVDPERRTAGRGWIGLLRNDGHLVTGVSERQMLPAWLALLLLLGTAALAWWREGKV